MFTITIDGPSASGKSTVADIVAKELNMQHLNSGEFYRAIALYFLNKKISYNEEEKINSEINKIDVTIRFIKDKQHCYLNGKDVTNLLHTNEINEVVSKYGHNETVVERCSYFTLKATETESLVIDGRNVGSFVLPDADCKIFLDCDVSVRAKRRYDEAISKGAVVSFEEILKQTKERDELDKKRKIAPLIIPKGAYKVDSNNKTPETVANEIVKIVQRL